MKKILSEASISELSSFEKMLQLFHAYSLENNPTMSQKKILFADEIYNFYDGLKDRISPDELDKYIYMQERLKKIFNQLNIVQHLQISLPVKDIDTQNVIINILDIGAWVTPAYFALRFLTNQLEKNFNCKININYICLDNAYESNILDFFEHYPEIKMLAADATQPDVIYSKLGFEIRESLAKKNGFDLILLRNPTIIHDDNFVKNTIAYTVPFFSQENNTLFYVSNHTENEYKLTTEIAKKFINYYTITSQTVIEKYEFDDPEFEKKLKIKELAQGKEEYFSPDSYSVSLRVKGLKLNLHQLKTLNSFPVQNNPLLLFPSKACDSKYTVLLEIIERNKLKYFAGSKQEENYQLFLQSLKIGMSKNNFSQVLRKLSYVSANQLIHLLLDHLPSQSFDIHEKNSQGKTILDFVKESNMTNEEKQRLINRLNKHTNLNVSSRKTLSS